MDVVHFLFVCCFCSDSMDLSVPEMKMSLCGGKIEEGRLVVNEGLHSYLICWFWMRLVAIASFDFVHFFSMVNLLYRMVRQFAYNENHSYKNISSENYHKISVGRSWGVIVFKSPSF